MQARGFTETSARQGSGLFRGSGRAEFGQGSADSLSMKWSALHDAAETIALIAGATGRAMTPEARNFPVAMRDASASLRANAEQGVADLTAVLEPGLSALLAVHARGADPGPPAHALWQEFLAARDAVLALAPANASPPPRRLSI